MKSCDLGDASTCRGNPDDKFGDYECRGWDQLFFGGTPVAGTSVCEGGNIVGCDFFGGIQGLGCASIGEGPDNMTNMSCRDMENQPTSNPEDPAGFCFDDTSSAPLGPDPDAGVPADAGTD